MKAATVVRAHGLYNLVNGVWPLASMSTFEAVLGPKTDRWLVRTVGLLLATQGLAESAASHDAGAIRQGRRMALATSATLAASDVWYVARGRISRMYLADAAVQVAWITALLVGRE